MTSKERVMLAFNHQEADRIPVWCGASPEFMEKAKKALDLPDEESVLQRFGDDFRRVHPRYVGPKECAADYNLVGDTTYRSPFGVLRHGIGYGQPINHPLENATMEEVLAYPWPNPEWMSGSHIKDEVKQWEGKYAILGGDWCPFFHDAIDLFGMEGFLIGMYIKPEIVEVVLNKIVDYYYGVNEIIFEEAAEVMDIFFFGNDLGIQTGPLFGGELFDKFIGVHINRLASQAKAYKLKVMMHSCGSVGALIDEFASLGIDALQALQPDAEGMEASLLKNKYGDKMVFNGCIDSHYALIEGTPEHTIAESKRVIDIMKPGGGFILSPSHDFLLEETPVENVIAMYDTARTYGVYNK